MKTRICICLCLALLSSGCATTIARGDSEASDIALIRQNLQAPVDNFVAFRFYDWRSVSRNELVVWTRTDEAYLIKVWDSCPNLELVQRIGITRTSGSSVTKFDHVQVGRESCVISEIKAIDVKKMEAARKALRAGAK